MQKRERRTGRRRGWWIVAMIALPLVNQPAGAQEPAAQPQGKSLDCVFTVMTTGLWEKDEPRAEVTPAKLSIGFHNINPDEGTAEATGRVGPHDVIVRLSVGSLHFLETYDDGRLYTTTVFEYDTPSSKRRAVHTRHVYTRVRLGGFPSRPEQYYGWCETR